MTRATADETRAAIDLAGELLARGRTVRYRARGRSMWPTILDGDRLTLAPVTEPVRTGDVVFLPTDDFGLAHRVVARAGRWCCVKGDARVRPDGWHATPTFTARVVHIERDGRPVPLRTGLAAAATAWVQTAARLVARLPPLSRSAAARSPRPGP